MHVRLLELVSVLFLFLFSGIGFRACMCTHAYCMRVHTQSMHMHAYCMRTHTQSMRMCTTGLCMHTRAQKP